jgi:hypothetical protein
MQLPESYEKLIDEAWKEMLYAALVRQINKDFKFANIDDEFPGNITPEELFNQFHRLVRHLMEFEFDKYLNLLYIIDVSESKIREIPEADLGLLSQKVSFLMLQREWQKVWIRHHFG